MSNIKTRFAVSPTGFLHIGGLRNALYDYLFARQNNGQVFLRIDDTDQKREVEGAVQAILEALQWAGLTLDQKGSEMFIQSKRKEIYLQAAEKLLETGQAYYCFCSTERLQEMREQQQAKKLPPRYDRKCMNIPLNEARERIKNGELATIRFRLPDDREVIVQDLIRKEVHWHTRDLQDNVIVKSDGMALYHLADVVDNEAMQISHVLRSEEWLPSLPIHILLCEALNYQPPFYAHLPVILNEQKKKLSKRHDAVAVRDFIDKGVLPEAMLNFLAFLGWNPGDEREFFTLPKLISEFSLERVHKASAIFDNQKLESINSHYIREKSIPELLESILPFLKRQKLTPDKLATSRKRDFEYQIDLPKALETIRERLKYLSEAPELLSFYFELADYDTELLTNPKMKVDQKIAQQALEILQSTLTEIKGWDEENLKETLFAKVEELSWKNGQLLWPLRAALTGKQFSPGAFEVATVLGQQESLWRIGIALEKIKS